MPVILSLAKMHQILSEGINKRDKVCRELLLLLTAIPPPSQPDCLRSLPLQNLVIGGLISELGPVDCLGVVMHSLF